MMGGPAHPGVVRPHGPRKPETVMGGSCDDLRPSEVVHLTIPDPAEQAPLVARSVTPPSPSGRGGTTLLRQRAPRSCTVFVMTPPNEHTSEGGRDDRGVPYHAESALSSAQVLNRLYIISGERGTVALRHEARCTCQCCPGLLSARPMGGRCLCCYGMPHGCDWPAPRRVSSAWRSDRGQRNSPGLNLRSSQELPQALARVMAHATRLNARLASRKCDRPRSRQSTAC